MFDAVIFDLDGTLVDTEVIALETGMAAFRDHGQEVTLEFMHSLIGADLVAASRAITASFPHVDLDSLNRQMRDSFNSRIETDLPLKPTARELLSAIRLPRALVTSSHRAQCDHKLAVTGLGPFFDHVVVFEDVTEPKPAPEPYLLAARLMGVSPARCLVFEDSEIGAEAAHRAGMVVVQVPDVKPTEGRFAHHVAPDLLTGARRAGLQV